MHMEQAAARRAVSSSCQEFFLPFQPISAISPRGMLKASSYHMFKPPFLTA
jgi:hypothetical protein